MPHDVVTSALKNKIRVAALFIGDWRTGAADCDVQPVRERGYWVRGESLGEGFLGYGDGDLPAQEPSSDGAWN